MGMSSSVISHTIMKHSYLTGREMKWRWVKAEHQKAVLHVPCPIFTHLNHTTLVLTRYFIYNQWIGRLTDWLGTVYRPISMVLAMWDAHFMDTGQTVHGSSWSPRQELTCNMRMLGTQVNMRKKNSVKRTDGQTDRRQDGLSDRQTSKVNPVCSPTFCGGGA